MYNIRNLDELKNKSPGMDNNDDPVKSLQKIQRHIQLNKPKYIKSSKGRSANNLFGNELKLDQIASLLASIIEFLKYARIRTI